MILSDQVPSSVKRLWNTSQARSHTAFGRLSSLITFPVALHSTESIDKVGLAQLGLVCSDDKLGKLKQFQEFKVELENVFEHSKKVDLQGALEK
jgi:hypothetical protein